MTENQVTQLAVSAQTDPVLEGSTQEGAPQERSTQERSTQERSTEFVPVAGGSDTTSAEVLLVAAYAAMWFLVFLFVWLTARRQRAIDARLGDVESALRRLEDEPSARAALGAGPAGGHPSEASHH